MTPLASSSRRATDRKVSIMSGFNLSAGKGCGILAVVLVGLPLLVVGVVGVKTWVPLQEAGKTMDELDRSLGQAASYLPAPSGGISPERMELFLELRTSLVSACDEYGSVRKGSDSVASPPNWNLIEQK